MTPMIIAASNPTPVILICVGVSAAVGVICMAWAMRKPADLGLVPDPKLVSLDAQIASADSALSKAQRARRGVPAARSKLIDLHRQRAAHIRDAYPA